MADVIKHTVSSPATMLTPAKESPLVFRLPKTGTMGAGLMMFKAMVGAGLFAMPYAFRLLGFGGGILAAGLCAALTWYTNVLIVRVHDVVVRDTLRKDLNYVSLVEHTFGRLGAYIVYGLIVFTTVGGNAAYLIFMGQVMNSILPQLSITAWAGVLAGAVLPLCLVRNGVFLAWTSMLGNVGVALVVATVLAKGAMVGHIRPLPTYTAFRPPAFMAAFGIIGFLYACSTTVMTIQKAMAHKARFSCVMGITIMFTFLACSAFAIVNYLYFGDDTCSIVVLNIGGGPLGLTAKIAIVIDLAFTYPLAMAGATEVIERSLFNDTSRLLWWKQAAVRTLFVAATFLISFAPQFSIILNIVGGWSVSALAFILPCIMLLQLRRFHYKAYMKQMEYLKAHLAKVVKLSHREHDSAVVWPEHTSRQLNRGHRVINVAFDEAAGAAVAADGVDKTPAPTPLPAGRGVDGGERRATGLAPTEVVYSPHARDGAHITAMDWRVASRRSSWTPLQVPSLAPTTTTTALPAGSAPPTPTAHARRASAINFFASLVAPRGPVQFNPWTGEVIANPHAMQHSLMSTSSPIPHSPSLDSLHAPTSTIPRTNSASQLGGVKAVGDASTAAVTSPDAASHAVGLAPSPDLASPSAASVVSPAASPATDTASPLTYPTTSGPATPVAPVAMPAVVPSTVAIVPAAQPAPAAAGPADNVHDDGHFLVPAHVAHALQNLSSNQLSVNTGMALMSMGRAVGTAMRRAPLPTWFPVVAPATATPASPTSANRRSPSPSPRGSLFGSSNRRLSVTQGSGPATPLPVTSLALPDSKGHVRRSSRGSGVAVGGSRTSATDKPMMTAPAASPSHVDVFVHGHHVTRPRLGTAMDVTSVRAAPGFRHASASTIADVTGMVDDEVLGLQMPADVLPIATTSATTSTSAATGVALPGVDGALMRFPVGHRLPAITDVDESAFVSPPLRGRGASDGAVPPSPKMLDSDAIPVPASDGNGGGGGTNEEPGVPMLSAVDKPEAAAPAPIITPTPAMVDSHAGASEARSVDAHAAKAGGEGSGEHGGRGKEGSGHGHGHHGHRGGGKVKLPKRKGRHLEALQLLGVGNAAETAFLWLVAAFGLAVLIMTTVQSVQEATGAVSSGEPAFCRGK